MDKLERYMEAKRLREEGWSIRKIAKELGASPNTIGKYLKKSEEEMFVWLDEEKEMKVSQMQKAREKRGRGLSLKPYKDIVLRKLREEPSINATELREWLKKETGHGFGLSTVRRFAKELRDQYNLR